MMMGESVLVLIVLAPVSENYIYVCHFSNESHFGGGREQIENCINQDYNNLWRNDGNK